MRRGQDSVKRPDFGRHKSFRTIAETHQQAFPWPYFRDSVAAQRFHMDKNIFRAIALGQEAKAARAIEPFDDGDLKSAGSTTSTRVRGGRHSAGCTALDPSIETILRTCNPFARRTASQTMRVPS